MKLPGTFQALRHRNFRLLWIGLILSAAGTWMQIVAQSLLVLKLTRGSAFALGVVSLAQALSFFCFAPVGGGLADRRDKRKLLLVTQSLLMALAFLLAGLTWAGAIRVWMIAALAFASGAVLSFDQPARNALVTSLTPPKDLMNVVSLQAMVFHGASTIGPALAGMAVAAGGYAGAFFLNGVSYLFVLAVLWKMRVEVTQGAPQIRGGLLTSIREALESVRADPVLTGALSCAAAMLFFGPSSSLLLPVFAVSVLHLGPAQLGLLFSAVGAGTVAGALTVASLGDFRYKGRLLFACYAAWTLSLLAFSWSVSVWWSAAALVLLGAAQNAGSATTITLMQSRVPAAMRGRVMSLNTLLIMGVRPLGDFPAGALIAFLGGPLTATLGAGVVGMYCFYAFVSRPALRTA